MSVTRAQLTCPVYGIACKLTSHRLPNVKEVMQHYFFVQTQLPRTTKSSEIVAEVAKSVTDIWIKSSIPTVSMRRVHQKIESLHQQLRTILKGKGETKASAILLAKQDSLILFDISACRCLDFSNCTCPREVKVPALEHEFLLDQRKERKMIIGSLDKKTTCKLTKKNDRALKRQKYYEYCIKSCGGASGGNNSKTDIDMDVSDNYEAPKGTCMF